MNEEIIKYHLSLLTPFIEKKDSLSARQYLEALDEKIKGKVFEYFLANLYTGNGFISQVKGGKGDKGADIIIRKSKHVEDIAFIIQAKNHKAPLTRKDTQAEIGQFRKESAKEYNCKRYRLITINGFVKDAFEFQEKGWVDLYNWDHIEFLIREYGKKQKIKPTADLRSHNKQTYDEILRLKTYQKQLSIVQATGTGKSYVIFQLLCDYIGKNILLIAPSKYIIEQFKNNQEYGWLLDGVDTLHYQNRQNFLDNKLERNKYDLIILDEFHRTGAKTYEPKIKKLLEYNPNALVIGATATPIRTDGRDMNDEFEFEIASNISLPTAIVKEYLPNPIYVASIIDLEEEIEYLKNDLQQSKNIYLNKEEERKKLEEIALDWKKSNGVDTILKKYLAGTKLCNFIVFCEDVETLRKYKHRVSEWFVNAGFYDVEPFVVHSKKTDKENHEALKRFETYNSQQKIALLFAVDMFNEGLHIKNVDGVILLRKTTSHIVFYQQIGRCLQVGKKKPIIFDLVNNFSSVAASNFLTELNEAKRNESFELEKEGIIDDTPQFKVFDHTKEIQDVLREIEAKFETWDFWFNLLLEWKNDKKENKNSDLNVPFKKIYKGYKLGFWVDNQRRNKQRLVDLFPQRFQKLNEIGFDWKDGIKEKKVPFIESLREKMKELENYYTIHNNANIPKRKPITENDSKGWTKSLANYIHHALRPKHQERIKNDSSLTYIYQGQEITVSRFLELIGFNWKPKNRFNDFIELLEKYFNENGDYRVKQSETRYGKLPKWVNAFRTIYNTGVQDSEGNIKGQSGTLLKEQIEYLNSVGFVWAERITSWDERFEQLKDYYLKNGHSTVATTENIALYTWCNTQKNSKDKLSQEQLEKLESVKFSFEINKTNTEDAFLEKLIELSDYFKERKTFYIKQNDKEYGKLRYWLSNVKKEYYAGSLPDEKFDLLKDIGLDLSENQYTLENEQWLEKFEELKKLYKKHKTFFFPKEPEYRSIKSWLQYQRSLFRKGQLKLEREELFKKLGYSLTSNESGNKSAGKIRAERTWISRIAELKEYYSKHEHYRVSLKDKQNDSLRTWIQRTKRFYREGKLTEEQVEELKEINFDFTNNWGNRKISGISKVWLGHFEELRKYYQLKGTFFISKKDKEFLKLQSWLLVQRTTFNQGKLEKEKVKLFEAIGYSLTTRYYQKKNLPINEIIDSWELRLNELKEYYEANNSFFIPISDIEHRQLLSWIRVQRSNYKKKTLSQERIDKLESIGYSFDIMYYGFGKEKKENEEPNENAKRTWEANYLKLINYKIVNGHCNVPRTYKEDTALANFVSRQRYNYRKKKLSIDQIKKLDLIGFEWEGNRNPDYDEAWLKNYNKLKKVFTETGSSHITKGYADNSMYTWTLQQRMKRRKNKLTQEQIKMLDAIKFVWNPESAGGSPDDDAWLAMLEQLTLYKKKFGNCNVSQLNKDYKKLGRWVNDQRLNYSRGKLHEHRKELLEKLGFIWNTKEYEFDLKIKKLQEFYQKNGHFDVKQSDKEFGGLYDWLHKLIKNGTTEERKKKLEEIGFKF